MTWTSRYIISYLITSYHIISYPIISDYIISYHIIPYLTISDFELKISKSSPLISKYEQILYKISSFTSRHYSIRIAISWTNVGREFYLVFPSFSSSFYQFFFLFLNTNRIVNMLYWIHNSHINIYSDWLFILTDESRRSSKIANK